MDVRPLTPAVGAEILDVDLARLAPGDLDRIVEAWDAHNALLFRGQELNDDQFIAENLDRWLA